MADRYVYFVLHGLASMLATKDDKIRIRLPAIDTHTVAIGHWLTEIPVPPGVKLNVVGVKAGRKFIDDKENLVVTPSSLPIGKNYSPPPIHAEIVLPLAKKAISLGTVEAATYLTGPDVKTRLTSSRFSSVHVLKYEMEEEKDNVIISSGQDGKFFFAALSGVRIRKKEVAVIHIVNEPFCQVSDDHCVREFSTGSYLLGVDIKIKKAVPRLPIRRKELSELRGLLLAEVAPGVAREFNANQILNGHRTGRPRRIGRTVGGNKVCGTLHGRE